MGKRTCECGCGVELTGKQRRWATGNCKTRAHAKMIRTAERSARDEAANLRRGSVYDELERLGLVDAWMEATLTYEGVKNEYIDRTGEPVSMSAIVAALQAHRVDRRLNRRADEWQMDAEMRGWLMLDDPWPDPTEEPELLEAWLERAVVGFVGFRESMFKAPRLGTYITAPCHRRWIKKILRAIVTGGQTNILSPPRHGKTELLVHFCIWLICRDPDVRILWVGPNGDIAEDSAGMVRENLENNTALIRRVLPPGRSFAPIRAKNWSNKSFTVDCRETIQKSATMTAIGRGGKILSRDVDLIISDDIEDFASTRQPKMRTDTRQWFTQDLGSRKEEATAWVDIGSRQHWDDLRGFLVEDPDWDTVVESAHDPACTLPETDHNVHVDCMLIPELRTHRWLMQRKRNAVNLGQPQIFDMVYLQETQVEGLQKWNRDMVKRTHDTTRGLGVPRLPGDREPYRIAGLDPSATGWQAGFAWAVDLVAPETGQWLYMVDLDQSHGGGLDPFLELAENWRVKHGIHHWVVEINMYRTGFIQEERCVRWANAHGVIIEPHDTQNLKMDPQYGVGSMASYYGEQPNVNLPYGSVEAQTLVENYTKELLRFVDIAEVMRRRARNTNALMASWFPMRTIRRLRIEAQAELDDQRDDSLYADVDLADYGYLDTGL